MVGTVEIDDGKTVVSAEMTTPGVVELVELFGRMKANGVTHCVMEVSSHALHQDRVAGIDFDVAMFTNLTGDHLDYHGTMEAYGAAKRRLFEGLKEGATAVVNVDDAWGERMVEGCKGRVVRYRKVDSISEKDRMQRNEWACAIEVMVPECMRIRIAGPEWSVLLPQTSLIGRHNAYNLVSVVAACCEMGIAPGQVVRAMKRAFGPPGRLQPVWVATNEKQSLLSEMTWGTKIVRRPQDFSVFVDYAHTHDSLENVLTALRTVMGNQSRDREGATSGVARVKGSLPDGRGSEMSPRLICVFGCGGDRDRTKRPKMGAVAERLADMVIVTSDNPRTENPEVILQEVCAGFSEGWKDKGKIAVEADRRAAIQRAIGVAKKGDVVLIAGKGHENYQIIGTTKHHFDDVEEAEAAIRVKNAIEK
jgi:UDP-N-acetylmuramoyl-L-alanyl-D-glutamate--2,6-diaminopimelate ligase